MSFVLKNGVEAKTYPHGMLPDDEEVRFNGATMSMADFCGAAFYILTNCTLSGPDDPRIRFVEIVKTMSERKEGDGVHLRAPGSDHSFYYPE